MKGLEGVINSLSQALQIGESLGVDTEAIQSTIDTANKRIGFTGESYVAALIGGTGVGKSSVLNAMAGESVSPTSVLRPTTERPRAWVSRKTAEDVGPLLDWLEVEGVETHDIEELSGVAIVDLPDFDSIAVEHRAIVDRLLPRLDVVIWVVDPEKYDDERLYEYLRMHGKDLPTIHMVLNKTDQLSGSDQQVVAEDLTTRLGRSGLASVDVRPVSAVDGSGIADLRAFLARQAEAKAAISDRIRAEARSRLGELGDSVGIGSDGDYRSLLDSATVELKSAEATEAAVNLVDLEGLVGHLRNSYLERSRSRAGSLLSRLMTLIRYASGHTRRHAEPKSFLLNWRTRGESSRVVNPVRAAYLEATGKLSPGARARTLDRLDPEDIRSSVESVIDGVVRDAAAEISKPRSWVLGLLSFLQWIATAGTLFGLAWYLIVIFGPEIPVGSVDLPGLGPVPTPLALGVSSVILSVLVGLLGRIYAGLASARHGRRLRKVLLADIAASIRSGAFGPLDEIEDHRRELAEIIRRLG